MAKISIIMPVYNAERFLRRALNSLITQTYTDIEILCVDDGSQDSSYSVLLDYEQQDSRVKVFIQPNKGTGIAKNLGLQNATGNYVMFCDADDYYEPTMCEEMLNCLLKEQVDLVVCNVAISEDEKKHNRSNLDYFYLKNFGRYDLTLEDKPYILGVVWNKLYRMDIIKKYEITFLSQKNIGNDNTFVYKYIISCNSMFLLETKLYHYMLNSQSVMATANGSSLCDGHMLSANEILKHGAKYNLLQKKWLFAEFEKWLLMWYRNNTSDYRKLHILLQEMGELIPDKYYEIMPFFSTFVKRIVKPFYENNSTCYVFFINNNSALNLGIALQSLIANSNSSVTYDICILYDELSSSYKKNIMQLQQQNISIRFVCIISYLNEVRSINSAINDKGCDELILKILISRIFLAYKKVCYLASSMLFLKDIATIFDIDLEHYFFAATNDYKYLADKIGNNKKNRNFEYMLATNLLIFNIQELTKHNFFQNCCDELSKMKHNEITEQNFFNFLFYKKFKKILTNWNVQLTIPDELLKKINNHPQLLEYNSALLEPYILYFGSYKTPWNNLEMSFYTLWWKYARMSIFYEEVLLKLLH